MLQCRQGGHAICLLHVICGIVIPLVASVLSAALLAVQLYRQRLKRLKATDDERRPLLAGSYPVYGTAVDEESIRNVDASCPSPWLRFLAVGNDQLRRLEKGVLMADIALGIALVVFAARLGLHIPMGSSLAMISSSSYLLCLLVISTRFDKPWTMQYHLGVLFLAQYLCILATTHSVIFDFAPKPLAIALSLRPIGYTLLLLRHVRSGIIRIGPALLDFEADISKPAGLVSRLTLSWIQNGGETRLDSPELQDILTSASSGDLSACKNVSHSSSLLPTLLRHVGSDLLRQGAWAALASLLLFAPALILRAILIGIESSEAIQTHMAWFLVSSLLISGLISGIANAQCQWTGSKIYARLNGLITSDIYERMLQLPLIADASKTILTNGTILSNINVDAPVISEMGAHLHLLWITMPTQLVFAICALYSISGISGIFGLAVYIVFLPALVFFLKEHAAAEQKTLAATRTRTESTADFLSAIRAIKYFAWEKCIQTQLSGLREEELCKKKSRILWGSAFSTACCSMPLIATASSFLFQSVVLHTTLRSSTAFPVIVVFAALRLPMERAAQVMALASQAHISVKRIDETLREQEKEVGQRLPCINSGKLGFEGATLRWPTDGDPSRREHWPMIEAMLSAFRLGDLNIEFLIGKINVVFGHPGCGKSSLLLALLGEMEIVGGSVFIP
ncbi:hypothetical protein CDD81_679 [Ophiocordyceps australis]|uniref:ABC transmembrane type-1 domain-containing protein n=1 Tax=Ophiocordyceps australis TaxID=1399860 RepID=A0A2C5XFY8_9HYPO|nr:hypothetical protein CDD81_679 [Ophiocordyceps australis]